MSKVKSVEELEVFKKAHNLTLNIYKISKKFPAEERFGLTSQIRRAGASICTNLMEGSHRLGRKEFRQFVGIAKGSTGELKYHLLLAKDLEYLPEDQFIVLRSEAEEISKMLNGLAKSLSDTDTDTDTK
jgi:four helix bundle protein